MPTSSSLTEQLATLGIHLPAWPEEPEGGGVTSDWIQRGKAYAEGVRLWRAQLRNAPESTKGVVDQLMRHLHDTEQLGDWDQVVVASIKSEVHGMPDDERWQACGKLIRSMGLTPAQLLGVALELAREQELIAAIFGVQRLLKEQAGIGLRERLELCAELIATANTRSLMLDALAWPAHWKRAVVLHEQMTGLLAETVSSESASNFSRCSDQEVVALLLKRLERLSKCLSSELEDGLHSLIQPDKRTCTKTPPQAHVPTGPPVTLTTISSRMTSLPAVLESLRQQTYRPAKVYLHLSQEAYLLDRGIAEDNPVLQEVTADGWVQVCWVPNMGPYRKVFPFLQAGGYGQSVDIKSDNDLFITVDDDTLYPPRFIEYLLRNYKTYGCIVAHRGRRIRLSEIATSLAFLPYAKWHDGVRDPRLSNLPTGQGGVLYRRSWFPKNLESEMAFALAPTHDDLWLRWLTARQGVPAVILQPNAVARTSELSFPAASAEALAKKQTLWDAYNRSAGGNDKALIAIQAYWQLRDFDMARLLAEEKERQADLY
jgi:hypothetical protein